jgi:membrane protein DedA with SNARE-associated domain
LDAAHTRPRPSRRTTALIITPIIVLFVAALVGDLLTTTLADSHPLLLMALNARNRVLVLVTNQVDTVPYYIVGTLRLLASDPLWFILGMMYGDAGIRWIEHKSPRFGEWIRIYEQAFQKAAYPLVFFSPNNYICLFAGAAGMSLPAFVVLNLSGTVARLYMIRVVGDVFADPIDGVLGVFARYRWQLFVVSLAMVAVTLLLDRRKGGTEIDALLELEHELNEPPRDATQTGSPADTTAEHPHPEGTRVEES